jgi:hypothetical protein
MTPFRSNYCRLAAEIRAWGRLGGYPAPWHGIAEMLLLGCAKSTDG